MLKNRIEIKNIPALVWGEKSDRVFIAVHGNMSNKEDRVIRILAEEAERKGYQTLSFDLPEHGERASDGVVCKVQNCVKDLRGVFEYARGNWPNISLFACSMGAYFSLLEYKEESLNQALFLSPVVDMQRIIANMMTWFNVNEEQLKEKKEIQTPIGQTLYWDYYCYVNENPIIKWKTETSILYGAKDSLCERDRIDAFVNKFGCRLEVFGEGEHFFNTSEQLAYFTSFLKREIK